MNDFAYFGLLHATTVLLFICGLLLYFRRKEGERSRKILSLVCFITVFLFSIVLIGCYVNAAAPYPSHPFPGVLPIPGLLAGLMVIGIYLLYPIEVIRPGTTTLRNMMWLIVCYILLVAFFCLMPSFGIGLTKLNSFSEIFTHITEFNVWSRVILLLSVTFCSIVLLYIPHRGKVNNTSHQWIAINAISGQVISVLYVSYILSGENWIRNIHLLYFTVFILWVTYQELFIRLFKAPQPQAKCTQKDPVQIEGKEIKPNEKETALWTFLRAYMDNEEPWRNPDISLPAIASALNTNRTTLSAEIHSHKFPHFRDFIASYRIKAFCDKATHEIIGNVEEAFFEVGFRSRSVAFDNFKKQTGMTPGQYLKQKREERKNYYDIAQNAADRIAAWKQK